MRKNFQKNKYGSEIVGLTRCFYRELATISDFIYYSIILEREYPDLSDFFERSAISESECLKDIGASILYLGGDPRIDVANTSTAIRLRDPSDIEKFEIERILCASAENIKKSLSEYDKLMGTICEANTVSVLTRVSLKKRDLLYILEQMIKS